MIFQRDPTLEELLREPIIQQMMLSDGIRAEDIRHLLEEAEARTDGAFPAPVPLNLHAFGCIAPAA